MSDALSVALKRFVQKAFAWLPFARIYPAKVVTQPSGSGPLHVLPDDESIKGAGFTGIAIRHGLPGFKVKVPAGARCRLMFDAADPTRPFVALWDEGAVTEIAFDGGTKSVARVDDTTADGELYAVTQTVSGVPVVIALYWRGPAGGNYTLVASGVAPPTSGTPGTAISGKITSGNSKFKA